MQDVITAALLKVLYQNMDVKAIDDECTGKGSRVKSIEDMQCTESANMKKYECYFSINLKKQNKLIQLATVYIKKKIQYQESYNEFEPTYRFDAVGISGDIAAPDIEWLQNVIMA